MRLATAIALLLLAGLAGARAQGLPSIPISKFPHLAIISPAFSWDNKVDVARTISATCPSGRAITGGIAIETGNASLRIMESYPDGASWVIRAVNRQSPTDAQPVRVRAFAICLLPVARGGSVQIAQYPRLLHLSHRFALAAGDVTTADRQACAQSSLVISGGLGRDPEFKGNAVVRMELSYPDQWGWNVRATNGAAATEPAAAVRVFGICLGADEGLDIHNYQTVDFAEATVTVKPGDDGIRQSIRCRNPSARALAGGVRLLRGKNAAIALQESFPDTPASWTLAVSNRAPGNSSNATVRLYAVCLSP